MTHISQPVVIEVPESFEKMDDIDNLMIMIADMLGCVIIHNDKIRLTPADLTRFHSRTSPSISVIDYLRRIVKYTATEKACLLILLIYIDRVCERKKSFTITSLTIHRFIITAITISSKALCDSYCTNSHYAKVGGITTQELNTLEFEFLKLIDWHLICTGDDLQQYYVNLVEQIPNYKIAAPNNNNIDSSFDNDDDDDEEEEEEEEEEGNDPNGSTKMVIDTPTSSSSSSSSLLSTSSISSSSSTHTATPTSSATPITTTSNISSLLSN